MHHQTLGQKLQASNSVLGLLAETPINSHIFVLMSTAKKLIDLAADLVRVKTFLDHVGRKLELTETHKVLSNDSENHVALFTAVQFKHILN